MTGYDLIWRTQDEIRTVVNAVLGKCIWNLSYNEQRMAIELELTKYLEEEEEVDTLVNHFPVPASRLALAVVVFSGSRFTESLIKSSKLEFTVYAIRFFCYNYCKSNAKRLKWRLAESFIQSDKLADWVKNTFNGQTFVGI